jgi:hypothetical protein
MPRKPNVPRVPEDLLVHTEFNHGHKYFFPHERASLDLIRTIPEKHLPEGYVTFRERIEQYMEMYKMQEELRKEAIEDKLKEEGGKKKAKTPKKKDTDGDVDMLDDEEDSKKSMKESKTPAPASGKKGKEAKSAKSMKTAMKSVKKDNDKESKTAMKKSGKKADANDEDIEDVKNFSTDIAELTMLDLDDFDDDDFLTVSVGRLPMYYLAMGIKPHRLKSDRKAHIEGDPAPEVPIELGVGYKHPHFEALVGEDKEERWEDEQEERVNSYWSNLKDYDRMDHHCKLDTIQYPSNVQGANKYNLQTLYKDEFTQKVVVLYDFDKTVAIRSFFHEHRFKAVTERGQLRILEEEYNEFCSQMKRARDQGKAKMMKILPMALELKNCIKNNTDLFTLDAKKASLVQKTLLDYAAQRNYDEKVVGKGSKVQRLWKLVDIELMNTTRRLSEMPKKVSWRQFCSAYFFNDWTPFIPDCVPSASVEHKNHTTCEDTGLLKEKKVFSRVEMLKQHFITVREKHNAMVFIASKSLLAVTRVVLDHVGLLDEVAEVYGWTDHWAHAQMNKAEGMGLPMQYDVDSEKTRWNMPEEFDEKHLDRHWCAKWDKKTDILQLLCHVFAWNERWGFLVDDCDQDCIHASNQGVLCFKPANIGAGIHGDHAFGLVRQECDFIEDKVKHLNRADRQDNARRRVKLHNTRMKNGIRQDAGISTHIAYPMKQTTSAMASLWGHHYAVAKIRGQKEFYDWHESSYYFYAFDNSAVWRKYDRRVKEMTDEDRELWANCFRNAGTSTWPQKQIKIHHPSGNQNIGNNPYPEKTMEKKV